MVARPSQHHLCMGRNGSYSKCAAERDSPIHSHGHSTLGRRLFEGPRRVASITDPPHCTT